MNTSKIFRLQIAVDSFFLFIKRNKFCELLEQRTTWIRTYIYSIVVLCIRIFDIYLKCFLCLRALIASTTGRASAAASNSELSSRVPAQCEADLHRIGRVHRSSGESASGARAAGARAAHAAPLAVDAHSWLGGDRCRLCQAVRPTTHRIVAPRRSRY